MNVLYIGLGIGLGGGGASKSFGFAVKQTKDIFKNVIILLHNNECNITYKQENEIMIFFESYNASVTRDCYIDKIFNYFRKIKCIKTVIKKNNIDVIIVFTAGMMIVAKLATISWNGVLIGSERGAPQSKKKVTNILAKILFGLFDGIVFQTEKARDFYGKRIRRNSTVIPNAYIPRNSQLQPFEGERKRIITAAGRLAYDKGFDILLDAFSIVSSKHPEYTLEIYGIGSEKNNLKNKIKELGLEDKARLCGFVTDVAESVRDSSVFVLPSRTEGIPNVLLEVMGAGVPCVATDCSSGGPSMLMENETRGLLVKTNDVSGLAEAICKLIENAGLAEKLGNNAASVAKIFSPEVITEQWNDFIVSKLQNK